MCINSKIQQLLDQKAALDAKISRLEELGASIVPVKNLVADLLKNYAEEAPEDLPLVWQEFVAIAQQFQFKFNIFTQNLEEDQAEITDRDTVWGELSDERDDLEKEVAELRSRVKQFEAEFETHTQNLLPDLHNEESKVWEKNSIRSELEKLSQKAQAEQTLKLYQFCVQCVESDNFAGFVQEIQHIIKGNEAPDFIGNEYDGCFDGESEYEPNEACNTIESILEANGFFQPPDLEDYDTSEKYETYRGSVAAEEVLTGEAYARGAEKELANPYKKPEDDFIELVKITNSVGYLKRRDNGELLAGYAAFSNKDESGHQTATKAKSRAQKWTDFLRANYKASEAGENLDLEVINAKISDPRKNKRMISDNPKLEFVYEIKFVGVPLDYLERVAKQNLSLLPGQVAEIPATSPVPVEQVVYSSLPVFRVKVNSFEVAKSRQEEIIRARFEEEIEKLGGSQISVALLKGSEVVESYSINDFDFMQPQGFDSEKPEYEVTHMPSLKSFKIYKRLTGGVKSPELGGWTNSVYPYTPGFAKREAAAADAVRRMIKAESAE